MAQFEVLRVKGGVLVIDCQSDFLADLPTRFVVPLRPAAEIDLPRLTPRFEIDGRTLTMLTPLARSIDRRDIEGPVASLSDHEYVIKQALDMLVTGF